MLNVFLIKCFKLANQGHRTCKTMIFIFIILFIFILLYRVVCVYISHFNNLKTIGLSIFLLTDYIVKFFFILHW